jgi:hypothetical protein
MPQINRKNRVGNFYLPLVGEYTEGEKLASLLIPWQPSICSNQVADRTQLKSGVGIPDNNKKVGPRTGCQINLRSGATGKKIFTSIE